MSEKKTRNLKRENEIRRRDTRQKMEHKVVVGYVRAKYPKVYEEAVNYTAELNRAHPGKKDLTKTPEFQTLAKKQPAFTDKFELKIELMNTVTATATVPVEKAETYQELQPTATVSVEKAETYQELQPLDDEAFNTLLDDLRQDPDIASFFDNIDFELDDCPLW